MTAERNAFPAAILNAEPAVRSVGNIVARYGLAIVIGSIGIFKFYPTRLTTSNPWCPMERLMAALPEGDPSRAAIADDIARARELAKAAAAEEALT